MRWFNNKLDLHGVDINKATSMVLNKFYDFDSYDYEDELVIVCGRGTGALILLVEQLLNENSYKYDYELNNYTFYIWKKIKSHLI